MPSRDPRSSSPSLRRTLSRIGTFAGALVLSCGLCLSCAQAVNAAQPPVKKTEPAKNDAAKPARTTILTFEIADIDSILIDPKDAALKNALKMLPARIRELPEQIPELKEAPATLFTLVGTLFGRGARVGIEYHLKDEAQSPYGAHVVISAAAKDEKDAADIHAMVSASLAAAGGRRGAPPTKASAMFPTMQELETPGGMLRWGPRQSPTGWRYELHFGSPRVDAMFANLTSPGGVAGKAIMQGSLDLSPLTPLISGFAGAPGIAPVMQQLSAMGLIGPDAVKTDISMYYTETHAMQSTRMLGAKKFADGMGLGLAPLTPDDLKIIPSDAAMAFIKSGTMEPMIDQIAQMTTQVPQLEEMMDTFKEQTGVDLINDVLRNLGGVSGLYTSEATGGSSLGSLIIFNSIKDSAKLNEANAKLTKALNNFLASRDTARGFIAVRSYKSDAGTVHSLQFPGMPMPLELSYAITNKFMFIGFNPQAVLAAVQQAGGQGDGGILTNQEFASALPQGKILQAAGFVSAPRLLRDGYPWLSMSGSFISNLVRSNNPEAKDREPGMIVPTLAKLSKGARSQITYSYWDGDDLLSAWQGDRSLLVNLGTSLGAISTFSPVINLVVGAVAIGALEAQRMSRPAWTPPPAERMPPPPPPDDRRGNRPNFSIIPALSLPEWQPAGVPEEDLAPARP